MGVPEDVICKVCKKVFCCAECRHKHELRYHAIVVRNKFAAVPLTAMAPNGNHGNDDNDDDIHDTDNGQVLTTVKATTTTYLFCPICEDRPLPLHEHMYDEMLEHIESNHLPLQCRKCSRVYNKIDDLKEFSKCIHPNNQCDRMPACSITSNRTCDTDTSKVTIKPQQKQQQTCHSSTTISTQTSPMRSDYNGMNPLVTPPISVINMRWKMANSKITHEEFHTDSVSSISSISNNSSMRRSLDLVPKCVGKLVRSTSTPVHAEIVYAKPKEQTFNATGGGQVSSIYNSGYDVVPDSHSPVMQQPQYYHQSHHHQQHQQQQMDNMNRYMKGGGTGRPKISAVTPLRQVMSKSIQKAFAEHGGLPSASGYMRPPGAFFNRKKMFESYDASMLNDNSTDRMASSSPPLDLRLSPVVRRTQNRQGNDMTSTAEATGGPFTGITTSKQQQQQSIPDIPSDIVLSARKLTTESIVITRLEEHRAKSKDNSSTTNSVSLSSVNSGNGTNNSNSTTGSNSSVFTTCRSVEIITSTTAEVSEVNIQHRPQYHSHIPHQNALEEDVESFDQLRGLMPLPRHSNNHFGHLTPITRIPGAFINKKIIHFEHTPTVDCSISSCSSATSTSTTKENNLTSSLSPNNNNSHTDDVFFTPNSTPMRKSNLPNTRSLEEVENSKENASTSTSPMRVDRKMIMPRKLSIRFSPKKRPPLRDCTQVFSRVEDITDDYDDEVFVPKVASTKEKPEKVTSTNTAASTGEKSEKNVRSWSFSSIVSSVMRLPNLKTAAAQFKKNDPTTSSASSNFNPIINEDGHKSIIKRCASIAGSLVRSKPLIDDEQLNTLKRKRTNTMDNQSSSSYLAHLNVNDSNEAEEPESVSTSTKRLRIQARKPIERMRLNS